MRAVDFLIVGQGLAGSALAIRLKELGASVLVIDRDDEFSATRVAAGLVTTIAGRSMNVGWEQETHLLEALEFYHKLEVESGEKLFHSAVIERGFIDNKQKWKWERKADAYKMWVEEDLPSSKRWPLGGIALKAAACSNLPSVGAGWLDTKKYLAIVREILGHSFLIGEVRDEDFENLNDRLKLSLPQGDWSIGKVIFCQGALGLLGGAFSYIKHRCAKGEILTMITEREDETIYSSNGWLVPIGKGLCRVGATYEWNDLNCVPTEEGKAELLEKVSKMLHDCGKVVKHEAAVRPIIRTSQPVYAEHPNQEGFALFNGLGSKGVTYAPRVARQIAEHLVADTELPSVLQFSA